MDEQAIPWEEIIATIVRRRRLIVRVAISGIAIVALWIWLRPPVYKATAKLMVRAQRTRLAVSPEANARPIIARTTDQEINSQVSLVRSPSLIREVLSAHRDRIEPTEEQAKSSIRSLASAVTYPLEIPAILYRSVHKMPAASPFEKWVVATANTVEAEPVSRSNLIEVSYKSRDPLWAAQFVNELLSHHIDRYTLLHEQSNTQRFFERQRELLGSKLRKAKAALKAFREGKGSSLPLETEDELRQKLADLESTRDTARRELAEAQAREQFLTTEIKNHPVNIAAESRVVENQAVQFLKPRILELEMERAELLTKYAPGSSKVRDVKEQIQQARKLLAKEQETIAETMTAVNPAYQALEVDLVQTRSQIAALEARLAAISSQIDDYRDKLASSQEMASEQERLKQEVVTSKEAYLTYLKKEEQARFSKALDESRIVNIRIAEKAQVPATPESSNRLTLLAAWAVLSLAAGIGLAFASDRMDPSVKSTAQAKRATSLPILTEIPA